MTPYRNYVMMAGWMECTKFVPCSTTTFDDPRLARYEERDRFDLSERMSAKMRPSRPACAFRSEETCGRVGNKADGIAVLEYF